MHVKVKSFAGDDEIQLLNDFAEMMENSRNTTYADTISKSLIFLFVPRMLVNGITIPSL